MYDKVCADVACGRALVLDLDSAAAIRGLRIPPLAVVLKPKVPIVHEFTFARADRRTSVNDTKYYSVPPFDPGSARCDVCCCGFYSCNRNTVRTLELSCAR